MYRVEDSARRRDDTGQRRSSSQGTRYFEPVVVRLMRTSILSLRATDSLPLRTPHLGRVIPGFFRLKLRLTFLMPGRARLPRGWVTACKCRSEASTGCRFADHRARAKPGWCASRCLLPQVAPATGVGEHVELGLRSARPQALGPLNAVECCLTEEKPNVNV